MQAKTEAKKNIARTLHAMKQEGEKMFSRDSLLIPGFAEAIKPEFTAFINVLDSLIDAYEKDELYLTELDELHFEFLKVKNRLLEKLEQVKLHGVLQ